MNNKTIDEKQIMYWLSEAGIYKDKTADDDAHFHFLAEFPPNSGWLVHIIQPKNRDDLILIVNEQSFPMQHTAKLKEMDEKERAEFLHDISMTLLFRKPAFTLAPDPNNPERVGFSREIYYDGLSKNELMEAIKENFRCTIFVIWKFNRQFGKISIENEPTGPMFA